MIKRGFKKTRSPERAGGFFCRSALVAAAGKQRGEKSAHERRGHAARRRGETARQRAEKSFFLHGLHRSIRLLYIRLLQMLNLLLPR